MEKFGPGSRRPKGKSKKKPKPVLESSGDYKILKQLRNVPSIEEVNLFHKDGTVVHFEQPTGFVMNSKQFFSEKLLV